MVADSWKNSITAASVLIVFYFSSVQSSAAKAKQPTLSLSPGISVSSTLPGQRMNRIGCPKVFMFIALKRVHSILVALFLPAEKPETHWFSCILTRSYRLSVYPR